MPRDIDTSPERKAETDEEIIFRRYRVDPRTGNVLDARRYGLKAWPIRIRK